MSQELPIEILTFDFLEEKINAAPLDSILYGLELHDTLYKKIEKSDGVRIGTASSEFAPGENYELKEFDAVLTLVCYAEIKGANKTERRDALARVFQISQAIAKLFIEDETLNGRNCRARILTAYRDYDAPSSKPYAVVNMPIVFNESGAINFERRRNY